MIHYALQCPRAHYFDGWFKSSASFESQAEAGLLACPSCASTAVSRALMAPRIAGSKDVAPVAAPAAAPSPANASSSMPAEMRAALQRIRAEVERNCVYVGPRFATEVRRIAEGETKAARPIYGEATDDEAAALAEDGIAVARIPWVTRAES